MKGFTLLELMLSVAAIGILAGFSLPVFRTMISKNDLDIATVTTANMLRRAQVLSQAVDGDTGWGVHVQSGSISLFKGTSYATRESNFDEVFDIPATIGVGGVTEISYAKFTGFPQTTGNTTFSIDFDSKTLSINEKGMVSF